MTIIKRLIHPIRTINSIRAKKIRKDKDLSDEDFLRKMFKIRIGQNLDLENPKTFNEKLQWLKLYDRNKQYSIMVDKHEVKDYVAKQIGEEYIAKEYGVWNRLDETIINGLPNSFVLKTTHGSGAICVCKDKNKINIRRACENFNKSLKENFYLRSREWPYKNVEPRIIAEELLVNKGENVLTVYKFFCFSGEPFILQVIQNDKNPNETIDYFDMNWKLLKLRQNFHNSKVHLPVPEKFEEMKAICRKLTKGIPFVRCDLYVVNDRIYFSEFTFFSDAGFEKFHPKQWDDILGEKIILPLNK